jgi:hypothetical protein
MALKHFFLFMELIFIDMYDHQSISLQSSIKKLFINSLLLQQFILFMQFLERFQCNANKTLSHKLQFYLCRMPWFIKMLISSALDSTRVSILLSKYKRKRQSKALFCMLHSEPTTKHEEWRYTYMPYFKTAHPRCINIYIYIYIYI